MSWYFRSIEEIRKNFNVDPGKGLNDEQIRDNRAKYGRNSLSLSKRRPWILVLLDQLNDPVIYILAIAAIINLFIDHPKDSIVIAVVVVLNSLIGFVQEIKASDALKALQKMSAPNAKVTRNGETVNIPTTEVVVGDVIKLESGMRVPADARLIETHNFVVDESMLTGESFAIEKSANSEVKKTASLGDRKNMIFSGTIVQKGRATGIVTEVGTNTEFGKISQKVAEADETVSPLQLQISKFTKGLSIAIVVCILIIFLLGYLRDIDLITMFMTSVGLAVSAIPEGLPVAVTITLSIGVSQMAKRKAIVKKLAAVETLGSTNVICTDKTGTLTKNQMSVSKFCVSDRCYDATGSGYEKKGAIIDEIDKSPIGFDKNPAIEKAAMVSALCTETSISHDDDSWKVSGDPTEAALMIAAKKLDFDGSNYKVKVDIPFESELQLMAVRAIADDKKYILMKGAPEKIFNRCKDALNEKGEKVEFDREKARERVDEFSEKALRVLALAYTENVPDRVINETDLKDFTFVGFAGIRDAVREEAVEAVRDCRSAGVRVVMITGDHDVTAQAVGKEVGIAKEKEKPVAVRGSSIDDLSDDDLFKKVPEIDVYARVAPQHKFRIVQQLQKRGNIVAMTGDGVNDAPALKQADIGIAMGGGTDVAREAAQMILMDDNFATIVRAIRRGRIILHNLKHILLYILSTSFGGILTIALSVIAGFPLPVLPTQLLWINLVTDGTSTVPLAFEKEHGDVMYFPPRDKNEPLINRSMIYRMIVAGTVMMIGTLGVFYFSSKNLGLDIFSPTLGLPGINPDIMSAVEIERAVSEALKYPRTLAFCMLAFFQIWNVQNSRSLDRSLFFNLPHPGRPGVPHPGGAHMDKIGPEKNPILLGVMLLAIALQVAAVEIGPLSSLLETQNLNPIDWVTIFGVSFSIIVIIEIIKFLRVIFFKDQIAGK